MRRHDRVRERKRKLTAGIENIVIAGAGQAGGRAAEALRARGFQGAITILGNNANSTFGSVGTSIGAAS